MQAPSTPHPTEAVLSAYRSDTLANRDAQEVYRHLEACPDCRRRLTSSNDQRVETAMPGLSSTSQVEPAKSVRTSSTPAASAASKTVQIPEELAANKDYEVLRELGRGGMGVVYLARNRMMDRLEVLKVLNKAMLHKQGMLDRFLREIRSAARLSHPNVVAAYTALQLGELVVFVMEYVEGQDLAEVIKANGPLSISNATYYTYQAALGLQQAHLKGMVHRDIKPSNLILAREGKKHVVKILDFGLAKATSENPLEGGLTSEGQILGTPDYIAPEQVTSSAEADIRADIYSLGCTLYYLICGEPPFRGASLMQVLYAHQHVAARPVNELRPDAPVELTALVARMMAKDPAKRYQTPGEVAAALIPIFRSGPKDANASKTERLLPLPKVEPLPTTMPIDSKWDGLDQDTEIRSSGALRSGKTSKSRILQRKAKWWQRPGPLAGIGVAVLALAFGIWLLAGSSKSKVRTGDEISRPDPKGEAADGEAIRFNVGNETFEMKFAKIPGGKFTMGSSKEALALVEKKFRVTQSDELEHEVELSPFQMGKYHVTRGQFAAFVNDEGYRSEAEEGSGAWNGGWGWNESAKKFEGRDKKYSWRTTGFAQTSEHPVVNASWNDARKFCSWLSKKSGRRVVLPSEAQWEYACRAGSRALFSFGNDEEELSDYGNARDASFRRVTGLSDGLKADDGYAFTSPVGKYKPNKFGLHDMHGNVWQWCADYYGKYEDVSKKKDPIQSVMQSDDRRVLRGGSWSYVSSCRSGYRKLEAPGGRDINYGFRVAILP